MPNLYIFAICEKVVMDKEERASLISLFNTISAQLLPSSENIPSNAVAPKEWWVFSSWETKPEDVGKEYRQVIQLLYPNGEPFGQSIGLNFTPQADKAYSQVTVTGMGFPIGQEGRYTLKMWLEYGGSTIFEATPIIVTVNHKKLTSLPANFITLT
jgi:hypothetical protein